MTTTTLSSILSRLDAASVNGARAPDARRVLSAEATELRACANRAARQARLRVALDRLDGDASNQGAARYAATQTALHDTGDAVDLAARIAAAERLAEMWDGL